MPPPSPPNLLDIEEKVLDIVAEQLGIHRTQISPDSRLMQDLHCDSLDIVEIFVKLERAFDLHLPSPDINHTAPAYKAAFTRNPFRLRDFAEIVYLQWGSDKPAASPKAIGLVAVAPPSDSLPFTQLSGVLSPLNPPTPRFEDLGFNHGHVKVFRRRTDGMRCMQIPCASVRLGYDGPGAQHDEADLHNAWLDGFLIDAEPVSTTAYARFLNSIGPIPDQTLRDWFTLAPGDKRRPHQILTHTQTGWQPYPGTETFPMILVSWFGAHAYARWANCADWQTYATASPLGFLPTEAQWEYAARGPKPAAYPWGSAAASLALLQAGLHIPGQIYATPADLLMAPVNALLGMTTTGLHHMAGNVWQWCADWYDPSFYRSPDAYKNNPVNISPTGVRSERAGSWVGPESLARSSYRRARAPHARGRCLGFRCVSAIPTSK